MNSPIYFYWPKKQIPGWLEKIEITGNLSSPIVHHRGVGLVINIKGWYLVWGFIGDFVYVNAKGGDVFIQGCGRGVNYSSGFWYFIREAIKLRKKGQS